MIAYSLASNTVAAQNLPAYHIETTPVKHIQAMLTDIWETPELSPHQWAMFAPVPPTSAGQDHIAAHISLSVANAVLGQAQENSPLHRSILWIKGQVGSSAGPRIVTASVEYEAVLYSRRLVSGPPTSIVLLSLSERALNLRSSDTINFTAPSFQKWLDSKYLHKQASERDLDFSFRVYQTIRNLYHYHYDAKQDRRASLICQTNATDCGGFSNLFVATLRANSIPAHCLAGRLAKSSLVATDYGQCHVKSEFFAEGIGWVPVDMSYGVGSQDKDAQQNFGNDPGDFLTMHTDTDLILNPKPFGPTTAVGLQGISHWVWGEGSLNGSKDTEDWQVKDLPLSPMH